MSDVVAFLCFYLWSYPRHVYGAVVFCCFDHRLLCSLEFKAAIPCICFSFSFDVVLGLGTVTRFLADNDVSVHRV